MKNPCDECIIQPICEKMCPRVIEFYKPTVRKRSKQEIEEATGYRWDSSEDEWTSGSIMHSIKESIKEKDLVKSENIIVSTFKYILDFIRKGL